MSEVQFLLAAAVPAAVLILIVRAQFQAVTIYEWETGLHYANGRFVETLGPGRHMLVRTFRKVHVVTIRTLDQIGASGLVDVSSAERLPFRMSAWFVYRVTDARAFHERSGAVALNRAVAAALAETAAAFKLEDLVAGRAEAEARLLAAVAPRLESSAIDQIGLEAVQLPPETRRLFVEVERARLEGLAALERARGEQAALRALANAARMLKDNPELVNLRLLQTIGGTQKGSTTVVLGQGALMATGQLPGDS